MDLISYIPGYEPEKGILFKRPGAHIALVHDRTENCVRVFDVIDRAVVEIPAGWLERDYQVDAGMADLINDLNAAGFLTSACCQGKHCLGEAQHNAQAYVSFREWLTPVLLSGLRSAGIEASNASPSAIQNAPDYLTTQKASASAWIHRGSVAPPTPEQIGLNVAFQGTLRRVFGDLIAPVSEEIRRQAQGALTSGSD